MHIEAMCCFVVQQSSISIYWHITHTRTKTIQCTPSYGPLIGLSTGMKLSEQNLWPHLFIYAASCILSVYGVKMRKQSMFCAIEVDSPVRARICMRNDLQFKRFYHNQTYCSRYHQMFVCGNCLYLGMFCWSCFCCWTLSHDLSYDSAACWNIKQNKTKAAVRSKLLTHLLMLSTWTESVPGQWGFLYSQKEIFIVYLPYVCFWCTFAILQLIKCNKKKEIEIASQFNWIDWKIERARLFVRMAH